MSFMLQNCTAVRRVERANTRGIFSVWHLLNALRKLTELGEARELSGEGPGAQTRGQ